MATSKKPTGKAKKVSKKPTSTGVFDIARPGSSALTPSSTSRPLIIKHQLMPDPMVNGEPQAELPVVIKPAKKVVITPIHDDVESPVEAEATPNGSETSEEPVEVKVEADTVEEPTENIEVTITSDEVDKEPTDTPAAVTAPPLPDKKPEKPAPKPEPVAAPTTDQKAKPVPETEPKLSPDTKIADVAPEPDTTAIPAPTTAREEDEATRARLTRLQKMIDEEEYFLPIETLEERRSRRVAIFGLLLIILLAAAWYNTALDAGLLPNKFNLPHTSFFSIRP